jgi:hypothetical protein
MSPSGPKRDQRERLLDAALEFIKNAPEDELNRLLEESGDDPVDLENRARSAFDGAVAAFKESKASSQPVAAFGTTASIADPLAVLTIDQLRSAAVALGVRRQVLAAFREHRVVVDSVPRRFLMRLASIAQTTVEALVEVLRVPLALSAARSYKAGATPQDGGPVTFDQLLKDAGHSDVERAALMSEAD